ncbi:isochorismatase hydrolase [Caballeronia arationis]|jgi:nicotinamidase-related amidase|nr:isochorismatase hydrolase [Caballeronia arationis]
MLLVIDMQQRLLPHIDGGETLLRHCKTLVRAAGLLGVPVLATEQNPRGLGATVDGLLVSDQRVIEKHTFDATLDDAFVAALAPPDDGVLVVAGAEAHVCVLLTTLGLLRLGYRVELVADAVGSSRMPSARAIRPTARSRLRARHRKARA